MLNVFKVLASREVDESPLASDWTPLRDLPSSASLISPIDKPSRPSHSHLPAYASSRRLIPNVIVGPLDCRADPCQSHTTRSHRREYDYAYDHSYRRPSPPPIATLSHSPSLSTSSVDRSSVSSPASRRSPTLRAIDSHSTYSDPYYAQDHSRQPRPYHHDPVRDAERPSHNYTYSRSQHDNRYDTHAYSSYGSGAVPHSSITSRDSGSLSYPLPGQGHYTIGYTDDAATKLSDRIRRRCFNCGTTDTSTWRRSNLSPGKVVSTISPLYDPPNALAALQQVRSL